MKTIYYKVPECCDEEIFEMEVEKNLDLNDDIDVWWCAKQVGKAFFKKIKGEWRIDESLKFFFYETSSKIYSVNVVLEMEAVFFAGDVYCVTQGAKV